MRIALRQTRLDQLDFLSASSKSKTDKQTIIEKESFFELEYLDDYFGKSGFYKPETRKTLKRAIFIISTSILLLGFYLIVQSNDKKLSILISCFTFTFWSFLSLLYLRVQQKKMKQKIDFELPIFLESLMLLVSSGLGISPALSQIINSKTHANSYIVFIFRTIYQLANYGMTLKQAIETVSERISHPTLRHSLIHLNISNEEGGELIPSLRNLGEHCHIEWKMSVEERVKRLENLVIFPVFASVLGLMLLTLAIPLTSISEFKENASTRTSVEQRF